MVDQPKQPILLNAFNFDPSNKVANFNFYKQTNAPGILPSTNISVKVEFQDTETVAEARKHAAQAAIILLQEVIEALEKLG